MKILNTLVCLGIFVLIPCRVTAEQWNEAKIAAWVKLNAVRGLASVSDLSNEQKEHYYTPRWSLTYYAYGAKFILPMIKIYPNIETLVGKVSFFHGSRSSSLTTFLEESKTNGALLPHGKLMELAKKNEAMIHFCGANDFGLAGVNKEYLSTVFFSDIRDAVRYAGIGNELQPKKEGEQKYKGWNPASANKSRLHLIFRKEDKPNGVIKPNQDAVDELEKVRRDAWAKLSDEAQNLILDDFPTLYGLNPATTRKRMPFGGKGAADNEIGILGGVEAKEITAIIVPENQVSRVQEIVKKYNNKIEVISFDFLFEK